MAGPLDDAVSRALAEHELYKRADKRLHEAMCHIDYQCRPHVEFAKEFIAYAAETRDEASAIVRIDEIAAQVRRDADRVMRVCLGAEVKVHRALWQRYQRKVVRRLGTHGSEDALKPKEAEERKRECLDSLRSFVELRRSQSASFSDFSMKFDEADQALVGFRAFNAEIRRTTNSILGDSSGGVAPMIALATLVIAVVTLGVTLLLPESRRLIGLDPPLAPSAQEKPTLDTLAN